MFGFLENEIGSTGFILFPLAGLVEPKKFPEFTKSLVLSGIDLTNVSPETDQHEPGNFKFVEKTKLCVKSQPLWKTQTLGF